MYFRTYLSNDSKKQANENVSHMHVGALNIQVLFKTHQTEAHGLHTNIRKQALGT